MADLEQEKFLDQHKESKDLKLIVDFNQLDISFEGKQMEIGSIKYKKKKDKKLKKAIVNLKDNSKGKNLF